MATILLSAVGASVGAGFGGTVLGLSGAVIGRAVGATLGQAIDQRLLGAGTQAVETGRISRFSLTGASEGAPVARVWGRVRIGGQVIWATRFQEQATVQGGGKGAPAPKVTRYSYSVSLAIALCEGEITRVGRIWADGIELARDALNLRVYTGTADQLPDPKIEAVQGAGMAPAYRGIAYVVIEDLALDAFGNRVPQFTFEVLRPARGGGGLAAGVRGVALMPGTGEYALATTPVHHAAGPGVNASVNVNSPSGKTDFATALEDLGEELPRCRSVSLVVSWFGGDLRCGACRVEPKVEHATAEGVGMVWRAGGVGRAGAAVVPQVGGRPVYGGTPADSSVIEAIRAIRAAGQEVMVYPFLLMDQGAGNGLTDPYTGGPDQPALPWRGRITLSVAPGRAGSPERSAVADAEVAAFFGTCTASDFAVAGGQVVYSGPAEWSYRRFILHYAHLAALAGGVDAFCVGSELRGLVQARGAGDAFPAVAQLRRLAGEVRAILGPQVKISYAADWSEYGGWQSPEGGLYFPLDPFWADEAVDFVGIDNYLPLSDWRGTEGEADAAWGSIYALDYLKANVQGGKDYDWYYPSAEAEAAQRRVPITDGSHGEPWVFRAKDFANWWGRAHFERPGGLRAALPTPWVPEGKPIRFTEFGCPAVDKGTNEPNRFLDPKSSESGLPGHSRGTRDDLIQLQYLRAVTGYWGEAAHNPVSAVYGGPMVDLDHAHVWAWDARPFPAFPNAVDRWADGANYAGGHWLTGRTAAQPLADVVSEICAAAGVTAVDVAGLHGAVRGFTLAETGSARAALQPLMLGYGFDVAERDGVLRFRQRGLAAPVTVAAAGLVDAGAGKPVVEATRAAAAETAGRVRLSFVEAEGDYQVRAVEAVLPDADDAAVTQGELPLVLTQSEGRAVAERWLAEARVARDGVSLGLPPSQAALGAGDVLRLEDGTTWRIDRVDLAEHQAVEAVRVEAQVYVPSDSVAAAVAPRAFVAPVPVFPLFLDLPLLTGNEAPTAPHLAVTATPWPGSVACWAGQGDAGYALLATLGTPAVIGVTDTALAAAVPGVWDRGAPVRVRVYGGTLASAGVAEVLAGANLAAIGDGAGGDWEVFQFAHAELVAPGLYELSLRLRGQAGTDAVMPPAWPAGSYVVLLNGAVSQLPLSPALRDVAQDYRIGPAARAYDDPSYTHLVAAFAGVGLRPYAPCHLAVRGAGELTVTWVRRTRIDGDAWAGVEVPLGEADERYLVRVLTVAAGVVREETVTAPAWTYAASARAADGVAGPFRVAVAQLSDRFGAGPFTEIGIDG